MFVLASAEAHLLDRWREWLTEQAPLVEIRRLEALPECVMRLRPQLVLLDLRLQRGGVLRDIERLLKGSPITRIIAFGTDCGEDHEIALFRAGVRGVCRLDVSHEALLRAITAVLDGELWIRRALVPKLLASISSARLPDAETGSTERFAILTPREIEITQLIAQGASNKHIARLLAITERTVKNHLTMIFRKVGVFDRVKLAVLAVRRH